MNDDKKFELTIETRVRHADGGIEVGTFLNGQLQEVRRIEEELLTTAAVVALRDKGYTVLPHATDVDEFTVSDDLPDPGPFGAEQRAEKFSRERQQVADLWFGGNRDQADRVIEALPYSVIPGWFDVDQVMRTIASGPVESKGAGS